jgi:signal peptidase I
MGDITLLGLNFSGGTGLAFMFLTLIALGANAKLFMKCEQPIWAAFVPGYNVVVAMRILGRPDAHALLFLVPVFNVYFFFKTVIELAQAFGKHTMTDFVLAAVFNVFYVLNLSLAWQEEYEGPVFGKAARQSSGLQTA